MAISSSPESLPSVAEILEPTPGAILRKRALGDWGVMIGGGFMVVLLLVAFGAPLLTWHDPLGQDLFNRYVPPVWHDNGSWVHPFGTDKFGRDYYTRIIYGARVSLMIGFAVMLMSGVIGTAMGIAAGYFGGRVDMFVTFLINTRLAMPVVLIALAVIALIGSSLEVVILVLGFLLWERFALVMRSSTQQVRNLDYVAAAEAAGCTTMRILMTEIMPNVMNNLIVVATIEVAHAILLEAALSFLGLGVQPPEPSWGLMISEGKGDMYFKPWVIAIPGIALFLMLLAINLLGDGIRDVTSPESRN
jgi:peptide/nickel transport system permease protein